MASLEQSEQPAGRSFWSSRFSEGRHRCTGHRRIQACHNLTFAGPKQNPQYFPSPVPCLHERVPEVAASPSPTESAPLRTTRTARCFRTGCTPSRSGSACTAPPFVSSLHRSRTHTARLIPASSARFRQPASSSAGSLNSNLASFSMLYVHISRLYGQEQEVLYGQPNTKSCLGRNEYICGRRLPCLLPPPGPGTQRNV